MIGKRRRVISLRIRNIGAGQLLSNHVAVEIDGNVTHFDREGLRQLQCKRFTLPSISTVT